MMLTIQNLTARYGSVTALEDFTADFIPGQVTALLGPNGSGKSTLLRAIAGIGSDTVGRIYWGHEDVLAMGPRQRARIVAYVPQDEVPEFDFTVREVVLMGRHGASLGFWESAEDLAAADDALRMVDALHFTNRPVTQLSGGERQRVLLARGLAQGTPVLLLDEPIAHLDPAHQVDLRSLLARLRAEGICVLVAVHDVNWAFASTDRTIMLSNGRIAADLPTRDLATSPVLAEVYGVAFRAGDDVLVPAALSAKTE